MGELLENPNVKVEGNQQPSRQRRKVQRLLGDLRKSLITRIAPTCGDTDDIVQRTTILCRLWKHRV